MWPALPIPALVDVHVRHGLVQGRIRRWLRALLCGERGEGVVLGNLLRHHGLQHRAVESCAMQSVCASTALDSDLPGGRRPPLGG